MGGGVGEGGVSTAATQVMASHKAWFAEAQAALQKGLDDLEAGRRALAAERAEFDRRKAKLEQAIAQAGAPF